MVSGEGVVVEQMFTAAVKWRGRDLLVKGSLCHKESSLFICRMDGMEGRKEGEGRGVERTREGL